MSDSFCLTLQKWLVEQSCVGRICSRAMQKLISGIGIWKQPEFEAESDEPMSLSAACRRLNLELKAAVIEVYPPLLGHGRPCGSSRCLGNGGDVCRESLFLQLAARHAVDVWLDSGRAVQTTSIQQMPVGECLFCLVLLDFPFEEDA